MSNHPEENWLEEELFRTENLEALVAEFDRLRAEIYPPGWVEKNFDNWTALRQVEVTGFGRADLVIARTCKSDYAALVIVIELKRRADENAVGQVLRYCGALESIYYDYSVKPIPVIGAFEFTPGAVLACSAGGVHVLHLGLNKLQLCHSQDAPFTRSITGTELRAKCDRLSGVLGEHFDTENEPEQVDA